VASLLLILLLAGDTPREIPEPPDAAVEPQPPAPEPAPPEAAPPEAAPPATQAPQPPTPAEPPPDKVPPVGPPPPHTGIKATLKAIPGDFVSLATGTNIGIIGMGGVLALAVHPADDYVNEKLAGGSGTDSFFYPGKLIGNGAVLLGVSLGTYAFGRATDNRVVSHLGMDLLRSLAVSGTLTYAVKIAVRRDRPTGACCSFPSGHASATFAFASVLWRHLGWKAAVPTYTVATYVALSRLHLDVHFLSDVVFGSAIGLASGRAVTRHDRHFWGVYPMPVPGGGIGVAVVGSFR
jgi:hypothetical protein